MYWGVRSSVNPGAGEPGDGREGARPAAGDPGTAQSAVQPPRRPVPGGWVAWAPLVLCLFLIYCLSGQTGPSQDFRPLIRGSRVLMGVARRLPRFQFRYAGRMVDNWSHPAEFMYFAIRKVGHVCVYASLGLSLVHATEPYRKSGRLTAVRQYLLAAGLIVAVGSLDELRQASVAGRSARLIDLAYDIGGFLVAWVLVAYARHRAVARRFGAW